MVSGLQGPDCITQHYIGIKDVFSECHDVSGSASLKGTINRTFNAPATPGVYYITQVASWEFSRFGRGAGYNFDNNNWRDAIAVLIVQNEINVDSIAASTLANINLTAGEYPIVLTGCTSQNYDVTYQDGVLLVNGTAQRNALRKADITKQEENVPQKQEQNSLKSYVAPNPATTIVKVQVANEVISVSHISVTDMPGRLQRIKNIKKLSGNLFEIDVSTLPKGPYFIKVRTAENEEIFRILKL